MGLMTIGRQSKKGLRKFPWARCPIFYWHEGVHLRLAQYEATDPKLTMRAGILIRSARASECVCPSERV